MNKEEYYKFVENTFADMLELIRKKNTDYSGPGDDPFTNFRRSSAVGVDPIRGLTVRLLDKVARIESYMQTGSLKNEGIEDAFKDLIGYSCLALGMLKELHDAGLPIPIDGAACLSEIFTGNNKESLTNDITEPSRFGVPKW